MATIRMGRCRGDLQLQGGDHLYALSTHTFIYENSRSLLTSRASERPILPDAGRIGINAHPIIIPLIVSLPLDLRSRNHYDGVR